VNHGIKHISIPEPCTQNWADMRVVEQGRFCQSCQKTVVDFTKLTNDQILLVLSSSGNACGRLSDAQLRSLNTTFAIQQAPWFSWKKLSIAAAIIGLVPFVKANAQNRKPALIKSVVHTKDTLKVMRKSVEDVKLTITTTCITDTALARADAEKLMIMVGGISIARRSFKWRVWHTITTPFRWL